MALTNCKTLEFALRAKGAALIKSKGDGHCLLYSIVTSWNQLCPIPHGNEISLDLVKSKIRSWTST